MGSAIARRRGRSHDRTAHRFTVLTSSALAPLPELGLVLQLAGLGAAVGAALALRAKHRAASVDTWQITTAWATLGLAIGQVLAALR